MNETDTEILILQTLELILTVQQSVSASAAQVKATIESLNVVCPEFASEYRKQLTASLGAASPSLEKIVADAQSRIGSALRALGQTSGNQP